mmetsp:Transcript_1203/g.4064  ORF Transcript_1203/g.4064 Transcript_1203/m.4064 type:complete len:105 (+) Transcript_1203:1734-2048(+)
MAAAIVALVGSYIQRFGWFAVVLAVLVYVMRQRREANERRQVLDVERRRVREAQQKRLEDLPPLPKRPQRRPVSRPAAPPPAPRGGGQYRPSVAKRYPRRSAGG